MALASSRPEQALVQMPLIEHLIQIGGNLFEWLRPAP